MRLKARQVDETPAGPSGGIPTAQPIPSNSPVENEPSNQPLPIIPTTTPTRTIESPSEDDDVPTVSGAARPTPNTVGALATEFSAAATSGGAEASEVLPSEQPSSGLSGSLPGSPSVTLSDTESTSITPSFSLTASSLSASLPTSSIEFSSTASIDSSILPSSTIFSSTETTASSETLSASDSLTLTVSYTAIIMTISGTPVTIYSAVPTSLSTDNSGGLSSQKIGGIAGGIAAGVAILIGILGLIWWRWKKRKEKDEWVATVAKGHHREMSRARLLEGEDMEDIGPGGVSYRDHPPTSSIDSLPTARSLLNTPLAPSPLGIHATRPRDSSQFSHNDSSLSLRLMRARGSETGSRFREEVWPPPGEKMVDPLCSTVDLGDVVSQVMGPSTSSTPSPPTSSTPPDSSTNSKSPDSPTMGIYTSRYTTTPPKSASPLPALDMKGVEGGAPVVYSASSATAKRHSIGELTVRNHSPDPFIDDEYDIVDESDYKSLKRQRSGSAAGLLDDDPFKAPTTPPRIISRSYDSIPREPPSPTSSHSPTSPSRLLGLPPGAAPPKRPSPLANLAAKYPSTPGTSTTDRHEWLDS